MRLKASPKSNSGSGCIVGFGKLIGGLIGGLIGLGVAISFLSNNSVSPMRQLEIRCEEASKTQANESDKSAFYESCISAGSSQIKAQERINQEQSTESNLEKITENNQPLPPINEPIQPVEISQEPPVVLPEVTPTETALPTPSESNTETTSQSN
jgi:hypothetical protein